MITSIKQDVDATGLTMIRFAPGGNKRNEEGGQGIEDCPTPLRLWEHPPADCVFQLLAAPSKRIVNVKDIDLALLPQHRPSALHEMLGLCESC